LRQAKHRESLTGRIVLNLIRANQVISRAELARKTGLQRSTVSLITEQLIAENRIAEGMVGYSLRGRNPVIFA